MKSTVVAVIITLIHVLLVSVAKGGGAHYGDVRGDEYRKAVKDIVSEMVDGTPKSHDFTYYHNSNWGRVSGSSRCSGTRSLTMDQKACHHCLARLQAELTTPTCLSSQTASASEDDSACTMSFWKR